MAKKQKQPPKEHEKPKAGHPAPELVPYPLRPYPLRKVAAAMKMKVTARKRERIVKIKSGRKPEASL